MRNNTFYFAILFSIFFFSCSSKYNNIPDCIESKINKYKAEDSYNYLEKVKNNSNFYYVFSQKNVADGGAILLDEACNKRCVFIGIAGKWDGLGCDTLLNNLETVEIIWEK